MKPRVKIDRCPLKFITRDILQLFRATSLADSKLSVTEQVNLPYPYTEAFAMTVNERTLANAERIKRRSHE